MTKDQITINIHTIRKMISNAGFIFTQNFMSGPVDLGDMEANQLVCIEDGIYDINNKNDKIAIEAGTFTIRPYINHPIFDKGPDENCKRFSLHKLIYQMDPSDGSMELTQISGTFWRMIKNNLKIKY